MNLLILVCDPAQLSLQRNQKGGHFVDADLQSSEYAKKKLEVASINSFVANAGVFKGFAQLLEKLPALYSETINFSIMDLGLILYYS